MACRIMAEVWESLGPSAMLELYLCRCLHARWTGRTDYGCRRTRVFIRVHRPPIVLLEIRPKAWTHTAANPGAGEGPATAQGEGIFARAGGGKSRRSRFRDSWRV